MISASSEDLQHSIPQLSHASRLRLADLSILREGELYVVGDPATAIYLTVPEIGVTAIKALQAGNTVADVARAASELAGEEVDVLDFASVLLEQGLVRAVDGIPLAPSELAGAGSWLKTVSPHVVRPFFSKPAWIFYGAVAVYCGALFCLRPSLWPSFHDFFFTPDPAVCVVASLLVRMFLASVHEICHWLAARAVGVGARFRISRRLYYVVFETDLSQLWSVPRRDRYSPLLAGMAFDVLLLAIALTVRLLTAIHAIALPQLAVKIAAALVLGQLIVIGWQTMVFLRTDLYAVLITALGCTNLYRVNQLTIRRRFHRLSVCESQELAGANRADLRAVRWFSWVSVIGFLWAAYVFFAVFIPTSLVSAIWMFSKLGTVEFATRAFWEALILAGVFSLDFVLPAAILLRECKRRATPSSAAMPPA